MSKKAALGETCDVVGYFNPNTWPIQVAISELNLSVPLQPMEYILDRSGRKINDPILEPYVGPKMLQRETSNKPVNILRIPTRPVPVADPRAHPIGQGFKDARGKWQPPAPADPNSPITGQPPAPSASKSSVTGMSIEEARKRGFIGKQRIVPEDYGMDETAGSPQRGDKIPTIKSSYESPARAARPGALPKELTDAVLPAAAPLVQSLAEAARRNPEAAPDLSRRAALTAVEEQKGPEGVQQFKKALTTVAEKKAAPAQALPAPKAGRRRVAAPVAPPAPAPAPASESPIMGGTPIELPEPDLDGPTQAPVVQEATRAGHQCPYCADSFTYPSQLTRHIGRKHKEHAPPVTANA